MLVDPTDALVRPIAVARCEIDPFLVLAGPTRLVTASPSATRRWSRSSRSATRSRASPPAPWCCRRSRSAAARARLPPRPLGDLRPATRCCPTTGCSHSRASSTAGCCPTSCASPTPTTMLTPLPDGHRSGRGGERARQRARRLPVGRAAPPSPPGRRRARRLPRHPEHRPLRRPGRGRARCRIGDRRERRRRRVLGARRARSAPTPLRDGLRDRPTATWPIVVDCGTRAEALHWAVRATEPEGVLHSVSATTPSADRCPCRCGGSTRSASSSTSGGPTRRRCCPR